MFLLEFEEILLTKERKGGTFFHGAAESGWAALVADLLNSHSPQVMKPLLTVRNEEGETPLHKAAWCTEPPDDIKAMVEFIVKSYDESGKCYKQNYM